MELLMLGESELQKLLRDYDLVPDASPDAVRNVHIDLRLDKNIRRYTDSVDLACNSQAEYLEIPEKEGLTLEPNDFIIGSTLEEVHIPEGYWGFIETKGDIARAGISSHNTDGHIDPGYKGKITLEIKNMNVVPVTIYPYLRFVQLFIFEIKGAAPLYDGKYQNSKAPTIYRVS